MYLQELENAANNELTHYEGDQQNFEGFDSFDDGDGFEGEEYTGFNDDMVDFSGKDGCNTSFGTEIAKARRFGITLTNRSPNAREFIICPSMFPDNPNRVIKEGVIDYTGLGDVLSSANGSPMSLDFFLEWIKVNPTSIPRIRLQTTDTSFFGSVIKIERISPYGKLGDDQIDLASLVNPKNFNDKIMDVATPTLQFDNQTIVKVTVPAGTEQVPTKVVMTLYTTANVNLPKTLANKRRKASKSNKVIMQRAAIGQ